MTHTQEERKEKRMITVKNKWESMPMGNFILRKNGWKVSFNPDIDLSASLSPFGFLNDFPVESFSDKTTANMETALIIGDDYYILNGDWREGYESLSSKKAALAFYKKHEKRNGSAWSSHQAPLKDY